MRSDSTVFTFELHHDAVEVNGDAISFQLILQIHGCIFIHSQISRSNNGNLRPEPCEALTQLKPERLFANDQHTLRQLGQIKDRSRRVVLDVAYALDQRDPGNGTGGNYRSKELQLFAVDRDLILAGETCGSKENVHPMDVLDHLHRCVVAYFGPDFSHPFH